MCFTETLAAAVEVTKLNQIKPFIHQEKTLEIIYNHKNLAIRQKSRKRTLSTVDTGKDEPHSPDSVAFT
jgi:hypothetical protein